MDSSVSSYTNNVTSDYVPDVSKPFSYADYVPPTDAEMRAEAERINGGPISNDEWNGTWKWNSDKWTNWQDRYLEAHRINYENNRASAQSFYDATYNNYQNDMARKRAAGINPYFSDAKVGSTTSSAGNSSYTGPKMSEAESKAIQFEQNMAMIQQIQSVIGQSVDIAGQVADIKNSNMLASAQKTNIDQSSDHLKWGNLSSALSWLGDNIRVNGFDAPQVIPGELSPALKISPGSFPSGTSYDFSYNPDSPFWKDFSNYKKSLDVDSKGLDFQSSHYDYMSQFDKQDYLSSVPSTLLGLALENNPELRSQLIDILGSNELRSARLDKAGIDRTIESLSVGNGQVDKVLDYAGQVLGLTGQAVGMWSNIYGARTNRMNAESHYKSANSQYFYRNYRMRRGR